MRFALGLTIVGAVLLMAGLMMILVGETLRLRSAHSQGLVAGGEIAAICGLASGVALLVVLIAGPADRPGRRLDPSRVETGPVVSGPVVSGPVLSGRVVSGPVVSGPTVAGDVSDPPLNPLPPSAGFVPPHAAAPRPEPAGAAWSAPGYADQGWHPPPDQRWDPRAGPNWSPHPAPGWPPQAEGGWSGGPAYGWQPAGPGDWDGGEADGWSPDDHDWGPDGRDDWGGDGHDEWTPHGQDGWGHEAWAYQGEDAWVPDGRGGWMRPERVPVGQEGWTVRPGQVPDGQAEWAEPGREEWVPGDQGAWIPDGRGGWAHPAQDDWGQAAAAAPYLDERLERPDERDLNDPADGHLVGRAESRAIADGHLAGAGDERLTGAHAADDEDRSADDDTSPIPVILAGTPAPPPSPAAPEPFSVWEPARPRERRPDEPYRPEHAEPPSADTQEKIEQIKDLYVTAESIGEDALVRHFEQLKTRQRSLIREFFEKAGLKPGNSAHSSQHAGRDAVGESAPDGAPLPR